ncbi:MAG TPA: DUF4329 domain-containing protein [Devosia sp.]|nr:DUF4329 domain-containing protein [Devosia sp.]
MKQIAFWALTIAVLALPGSALAQSHEEIAFMKSLFNKLQPKSIALNREFCGYLGRNSRGMLVATGPTRGREGSCFADEPPTDMDIIASYHTHGAFSYDFDSEVPSSDDLSADIAEETDGYIATPGGRIWFDDIDREKAILICDRNCVVSDNAYEADAAPPVGNAYTLNQLLSRERP